MKRRTTPHGEIGENRGELPDKSVSSRKISSGHDGRADGTRADTHENMAQDDGIE